jgi:glycosyltransferase involved in cell wall biosynthesis
MNQNGSSAVARGGQESVLVTFCNQQSSPFHSLLALDLPTRNALWIDLSPIPETHWESFAGVCGLCRGAGNTVVIATQGAKPVLAVVDLETAKISGFLTLAKCRDTHSVVFHDGQIYAISTGTNEIYRIPLWDRIFGEEELYWQYPGVRYDCDEIHLNGLTIDQGRFIASCFGKRDADRAWCSSGRVFYLDTEQDIQNGLVQPHTPLAVGDHLFVAESAAQKVHIYARSSPQGSWVPEREIRTGGYTRGLALRDGRLLIGISAARRISRSKKTVNPDRSSSSEAAIIEVDVATGRQGDINNLGALGREIYDIMPLMSQLSLGLEYEVVSGRIGEMEATVDRYGADIGRLWSQTRDMQEVISDKVNKLEELQRRLGEEEHPKVSVIIPTYNRAHLVGDSIRSVLAQTYPNIELIVVDDGSTDDTAAVIAAIPDERLRYIRQPNRGRSSARNHALSLATGRYITFLDSDDLYLPDKIEVQVAYLQNHPGTGMVYTSAHCIDQEGTMLEHKYLATVSGCIYESIAFFTPVTITLPTVMTYRAIIDQVGGFDENMYRFEDTDMWRRISKVCRIDAISDFTCLLRTHDDNTLVNQDATKIAAAVDYYAAKISRDDGDIDETVRKKGLAGLYRYYGHALCSVPEFSGIGKKLLRSARAYDVKFIDSSSSIAYGMRIIYYRLGLNGLSHRVDEKIELSVYWLGWLIRYVTYCAGWLVRYVTYWAGWLIRYIRYWLGWLFRFIFYRSLNFAYRAYSKLKRFLEKINS